MFGDSQPPPLSRAAEASVLIQTYLGHMRTWNRPSDSPEIQAKGNEPLRN